MRIGLFGGTFNPIHWGHLLIAESARDHCDLDRVVLIPSGFPPHKSAPLLAGPHRSAMVRLAIRSNPFFTMSDWEMRQERIVYTVETLAHFRHQWPRARLFFIIGSDSLRDIETWVGGRTLLDRCHFLIYERCGAPWLALPRSSRNKTKRIGGPQISLASHEIRERVKQGQSIRYQVPEAVERYIRRHRLYQ